MLLYNTMAFDKDDSEIIHAQLLAAEDEEDALVKLQGLLDGMQIEYGICMAEAVGE